MQVETGPLFPDINRQQIFKYVVWAQPDTLYTLAALNFYDENDSIMSESVDWSLPRVDRRFSLMEIYTNPAVYYRLVLQGLQSTYPMLESGIDRIDIWYEDIEEPEAE